MEIGKFPHQLLGRLLGSIDVEDPRVILGPRVGEDAAAVKFGDRLLVAKSDPVTMATEHAGWYAVQVCANDVACSGATPAWFLATILAPDTFTEDDASLLFDDILKACRSLGVSLIGGHSEVTHGLQSPIIMGTMLGEVDRTGLITTAGAQEGDSVVLTKGLAIEGTAILARDHAEDLLQRGVQQTTIADAAALLDAPGISVVRDAQIAAALGSVHAMHDVTEGGIATALHEIAMASGLGLVLEEASIPVFSCTTDICSTIGLDPLGLLGSGALLITLPALQAPRLLRDLDRAGIDGWEVGQMMAAEEGCIQFARDGSEIALPSYNTDELARYLAENKPGN